MSRYPQYLQAGTAENFLCAPGPPTDRHISRREGVPNRAVGLFLSPLNRSIDGRDAAGARAAAVGTKTSDNDDIAGHLLVAGGDVDYF